MSVPSSLGRKRMAPFVSDTLTGSLSLTSAVPILKEGFALMPPSSEMPQDFSRSVSVDFLPSFVMVTLSNAF